MKKLITTISILMLTIMVFAERQIDGTMQDSGTYGSTASGADYQNDDIFTGTGMINVLNGYKALVIGGKTIVIGGKTLKGFNY